MESAPTISTVLNELRLERGVSQNWLADRTGLSQPLVNTMLKRPDYAITYRAVRLILAALEVPIAEFERRLPPVQLEEVVRKRPRKNLLPNPD